MPAARSRTKRWSARVTRTSDALDLESKVFAHADPKAIARSLKRSALRSRRRKSEPFQSAMSMLNFYINRAGRKLPKKRLAVLERAKDELRIAFHRSKGGKDSDGETHGHRSDQPRDRRKTEAA